MCPRIFGLKKGGWTWTRWTPRIPTQPTRLACGVNHSMPSPATRTIDEIIARKTRLNNLWSPEQARLQREIDDLARRLVVELGIDAEGSSSDVDIPAIPQVPTQDVQTPKRPAARRERASSTPLVDDLLAEYGVETRSWGRQSRGVA